MSRRTPKRTHHFLNWFRENRTLFKVELILQRKSSRHIIGYFKGYRHIRFNVYRGDFIEIEGTVDGKNWMFINFIMYIISKNSYGYFADVMCSGVKYDYYRTLNEFLINECFKPLLNWCNSELVNNKWLVIYGDNKDKIVTIRLQNTCESQRNFPYFTSKQIL